MTRLVQIIRDAWDCLVRQPPDDSNKGLEWLRAQEREAHDATERIRERRIRQTELAFRRDADFLDDEMLSTPKRKGKAR